jgi:hypothetical protein
MLQGMFIKVNSKKEKLMELESTPTSVVHIPLFVYLSIGDAYQGAFNDGLYHGTGTLQFKNGDKYTGEFANGLRHGRGRYIYATGGIYEGDYEFGIREGIGRYQDPGNDVYEVS